MSSIMVKKSGVGGKDKDKDKHKGKGIKLVCQRCKWEWVYSGNNPYYATCPYCKTKVTVHKQRE